MSRRIFRKIGVFRLLSAVALVSLALFVWEASVIVALNGTIGDLNGAIRDLELEMRLLKMDSLRGPKCLG